MTISGDANWLRFPRRDGAHGGPPFDAAGRHPAAQSALRRRLHLLAVGAESFKGHSSTLDFTDEGVECGTAAAIPGRSATAARQAAYARRSVPVGGHVSNVTLTVTDREGAGVVSRMPVEPGTPPTAALRLLADGASAGQQIFFTGEASRADARSIVSYDWNFGSGRPARGPRSHAVRQPAPTS